MLSLEERCHSNAEREFNRLARGPRWGDDNHPSVWMTGTTIRLTVGRQEMIAGRMHREKERVLWERREGGKQRSPHSRGSLSYIYAFRRPRRSLCLRTTDRRDQSLYAYLASR